MPGAVSAGSVRTCGVMHVFVTFTSWSADHLPPWFSTSVLTFLPLTSVLAAIARFLLMFWHRALGFIDRIRGAGSKPEVQAARRSPAPSTARTSSHRNSQPCRCTTTRATAVATGRSAAIPARAGWNPRRTPLEIIEELRTGKFVNIAERSAALRTVKMAAGRRRAGATGTCRRAGSS